VWVIEVPEVQSDARIPVEKMRMARALEIPVFNLMKQEMGKLGKPRKVIKEGETWRVEWKTSHNWSLEYATRPQTSLTGNRLPDFQIKKDGRAVLAIECKNWAKTSRWSTLTVKRDILERFCWLPPMCRRILMASHLNAKTDNETVQIRGLMDKHEIMVRLLKDVVGSPELSGKRVYKKLWPIVHEELGFIRKARGRKKGNQKGQIKIEVYTPKKGQ